MEEVGRDRMTIEPEEFRVLVCGGRNYKNWIRVKQEIQKLAPTLVIHGGATGADSLAESAAYHLDIETSVFPANWEKYGKKAGPIRNQTMIEIGRPHLVLAFPGGKGTADMIRRAKRAGINVIEVKEDGK